MSETECEQNKAACGTCTNCETGCLSGSDHLRDECGIFGVFDHPEAATPTYLESLFAGFARAAQMLCEGPRTKIPPEAGVAGNPLSNITSTEPLEMYPR